MPRNDVEKILAPDGRRFLMRDPVSGDWWYCRAVSPFETADFVRMAESWKDAAHAKATGKRSRKGLRVVRGGEARA